MYPQNEWIMGRDSYHKLLVWFADGNPRSFFSLDWRSRFSPQRDMQLGLNRLRRLIAKYGTQALVAVIYENKPDNSGQAIERYELGIKKEIIRT